MQAYRFNIGKAGGVFKRFGKVYFIEHGEQPFLRLGLVHCRYVIVKHGAEFAGQVYNTLAFWRFWRLYYNFTVNNGKCFAYV